MNKISKYLLGAFLLALLIHTIANPDIWYHLALGQKILSTGHPQPPESVISISPDFKNFYWLFQIVTVLVSKIVGVSGLVLFFGALWVAVAALWMKVSKLDLEKPLSFFLALLAIIICQTRFQERPEVFSYLFLMIDIYLLSDPASLLNSRAKLAMLFGVQILWANSHGYFFLGPVIVGLRGVSLLFEVKQNGAEESKKTALGVLGLCLLLILASMISPFGWNNWAAIFDQWHFLKETATLVNETKPTLSFGFSMWNLDLFWLLWVLTAGATIFSLRKSGGRPDKIFAFGLSLVGLFASAASARNLPLLVFMAAPLWAQAQLEKTSTTTLAKGWVYFFRFIPVALALWVVTQGYYGSLFQPYKFGLGVSDVIFPLRLEKQLKQIVFPAHSRWFADGSYGSYLEYNEPSFLLYGDSRFAAEEHFHYFAAVQDPDEFYKLHDKAPFDFAVFDLARSARVVSALFRDSRWHLIYGDLTTALFAFGDRASIGTLIHQDQSGPPQLFHGEDLADRTFGNEAIHWTLALVSADQMDVLLEALNQLKQFASIPSPVFEGCLKYLKVRPNGDLINSLFALRPKMLALEPEDAASVDLKLAQIKNGSFWN